MASYYKLPIEVRAGIGTRSAREIRRNGKIPANYYYHGETNQNLAIDKKAFLHAIHSGQHVFEMDLNGDTVYAMIKDAQYHPVTEDVIHVDLMRVRRTEKMTFSIPLVLDGIAAGANEGGIVTHVTTSLEIECFPTDVPENITVDISGLELNNSMTLRDITLPADVSLISAEDTTIVTCNPPKAEIEPEPVEEEEGEALEGEEGEAEEGDGKEATGEGSDTEESSKES